MYIGHLCYVRNRCLQVLKVRHVGNALWKWSGQIGAHGEVPVVYRCTDEQQVGSSWTAEQEDAAGSMPAMLSSSSGTNCVHRTQFHKCLPDWHTDHETQSLEHDYSLVYHGG